MIKPKELRIGNLVHAEVGLPSLEVHEMLYADFCEPLTFQLIHPIPITEEWLIKLGFKIPSKNESHPFGNYKNTSARIIISRNYQTNGYQTDGNIDIKYVHQLQNIYFYLTGEELVLQ